MSERPPELPERRTPPSAAPDDAAETPKPTDHQALKQFIGRAREEAKKGGDVNVANLGEGARVDQIAVGRNILQAKVNIGTLVVPVRVLLVLVALVLLSAVAVWWIVTPGQMPAGNANVAIVEFGALDAKGNVTSSAQGKYLSEWMYNRLADALSDLPASARPTFWHIATGLDPAHAFQKRIIGAPIRTEAEAEQVAKDFNARIVIYGTLGANQDPTTFTPKFYISQAAGEADELSGTQQLGQPIPIAANVNDEYLEQTLQPIGRALVWFSRGLNNDLNGRYDLAYQVLKQGEQALGDWDPHQGKEVLYYFIGREALFLTNCETDARIVFSPPAGQSGIAMALDAAAENFKQAEDLAKADGRTYARATLGRGQVEAIRAQRAIFPPSATGAGQCRINVSPTGQTSCPIGTPPNESAAAVADARKAIGDAVKLLDQAIDDLPTPKQPRLEAKAQAVRATADTFLGQLEIIERRAPDADSFMQDAIKRLAPVTGSVPQDDRRTLSNVYFALGNAQFLSAVAQAARGDTAAGKVQAQRASESFDACVKLIPADEPDVFLRVNQRPNCVCRGADATKLREELK